jgi:glucose-6-phosphate 1-epimerase
MEVTELKKLQNGFEYIEINNTFASAKIALQGAHIFHYKRHNEDDILWLSEESDFKLGESIRGGIPVCWPAFGMSNPDLAQHGFARVGMWKIKERLELDEKTTQLRFILNETKESLSMWNYKFELELKVTISDKLTMELKTTNLDKKPFKLTEAFHTYFSVSDISDARVKGLDKKLYFDALSSKTCKQNGDITFKEEVDSIYQEINSEILLVDKNRTISINHKGSNSAVVWNPWIEKCARMSAMSSSAYKEFVCIETANALDNFKIIEPNSTHILELII